MDILGIVGHVESVCTQEYGNNTYDNLFNMHEPTHVGLAFNSTSIIIRVQGLGFRVQGDNYYVKCWNLSMCVNV